MKIIVDAFGGDNAPLEIIKGCESAVKELDVQIVLTGHKAKIEKLIKEHDISLKKLDIVHAEEVIEIEDDPRSILKEKNNCSMAVGMKLLADKEGDAFVSAGSTGALVVGSTFIVKRIKGIKRPALAPILPTDQGPYMLLDGGANVECRPEMLLQFGIMGSVYMNKVLKMKNPRVGLLNVGTEDTKGTGLQLEAFSLLKESPVNFIGNVEARDIPLGICDVLVCDGFAGNVVLKLTEGLAAAFMSNIKGILLKNFTTKLAAATLKSGLLEFKKKMDYTEYGGAPLMGTAAPVIKAHGSSDAKAIKNAVRQGVFFAETGVINEISKTLEENENKV